MKLSEQSLTSLQKATTLRGGDFKNIVPNSLAGIKLGQCLETILDSIQSILIASHTGIKEVADVEVTRFAENVFKAKDLIAKESVIDNLSPGTERLINAKREKLTVLMTAVNAVVPDMLSKTYDFKTRLVLEKITALIRLSSLETLPSFVTPDYGPRLLTRGNEEAVRSMEDAFSPVKTLCLVIAYMLTHSSSIPQVRIKVDRQRGHLSIEPNSGRIPRLADLGTACLPLRIDVKRFNDIAGEHLDLDQIIEKFRVCADAFGVAEAQFLVKPHYQDPRKIIIA